MASPAQSTAPKHRPHGRAGCGWQWQWRLVVVARPTSPLASKAACLGEAVCAAVPCQQAGSAALQAKFGTTSDAYAHTGHVLEGGSNAPVAVPAARSSAAALQHVIPQPAQPIHSTHTHTHAGPSSRVDTTPRACHTGPHTSRRLSECWRSCCMRLRASAPCWACWASLASSCAAPSASRLAAWAAS